MVGPEVKIRNVAREHKIDIAKFAVLDVAHSHAAAAKAVGLIRSGQGELLMKGSLHTDELMREVTASSTGLRTERRISHVFLMDVPTYAETLFLTDAAVNIFPDLDAKRDIVQNAIDLFTAIGLGTPRVAILSAVETVTSKIPATIDAAALCKMADRGQITGAILDGPLAFDNAIDLQAARIKGIESAVAGRAQILVVPDLEAGNMLAKNLIYLAKADSAGLVLGARVPIVLTSRANSVREPHGVLRGSCPLRRSAASDGHRLSRLDPAMEAVARRQCGFVERQISNLYACGAGATAASMLKGQVDGIGYASALARTKQAKAPSLIDQHNSAERHSRYAARRSPCRPIGCARLRTSSLSRSVTASSMAGPTTIGRSWST